METLVPLAFFLPALGDCDFTRPPLRPLTLPSLQLAFLSAFLAFALVLPLSLGTTHFFAATGFGGASTDQLAVAGVASVLPAASVARTENTWAPRATV